MTCRGSQCTCFFDKQTTLAHRERNQHTAQTYKSNRQKVRLDKSNSSIKIKVKLEITNNIPKSVIKNKGEYANAAFVNLTHPMAVYNTPTS